LEVANGADSNLVDTQSGDTVTLHTISATEIQGQDSSGDGVFDLSIEASTGDVTLTQYRAVVHDDATDGDTSEPATLGDNLIGVSVTVTDGDGDTSTDTADLHGVVQFLDDGPTASISINEATLAVDETATAQSPDDAAPLTSIGQSLGQSTI